MKFYKCIFLLVCFIYIWECYDLCVFQLPNAMGGQHKQKADKQDAVCFYHSDQSQTASLHLQRWESRTALMTHMKLCFIHMTSSARCPVARGKGHVMSAAEMPREEWLMSHTVSTYPVLQRPPPVSSPVANGVPQSGLPWVKTYTSLCPIITDVFFHAGDF